MNRQMNKGLFAQRTLELFSQDENNGESLAGVGIKDLDFFERERLNLIREFTELKIQDDIYVLQHRDNLV